MSNSKAYGTMKLIGCYLVDGDPVAAKAQEVHKITHFVDSLDEQVKVSVDVRKRYQLTTSNGTSAPVSIGSPVRKGTTYGYRQNGYYIEILMKKMVAHLTYTKEVTK